MSERADGTYVELHRELCDDPDFKPSDSMVRRIERWGWVVYGVRCVASIQVVENGTATCYTIRSAGCWGVVVPNDRDSYLDDIYAEQRSTLLSHLATFGGSMIELP